jgi:XTP/dITP diphosphohydrolase
MKILFATANLNKAFEIQKIVPEGFEIISLKDLNFTDDIPETSSTIEGNALQKTKFIVDKFKIDCFADDTGLEIEALEGEPGVYSARYAGLEKNPEKNMDLVLEKMKNCQNRKARFKTVIALYFNGETHLFEGIVNGIIRHEKSGDDGFGYDPIFEPENSGKTFAEMTIDEKNKISHRGRAFEKMVQFLNSEKCLQ